MRSRFERTHGQSLVEFALVFPILLFALIGFLDLGRAIYYYSAVSNAVREGTRFAIVSREGLKQVYPIGTGELSCAAQRTRQIADHDLIIWNKVDEFLFGIADSANYSDLDLCVDVTLTSDNKYYDEVAVTATYCFAPITPGIAAIIGSGSAACPNGLGITAGSSMLVAPGFRTD